MSDLRKRLEKSQAHERVDPCQCKGLFFRCRFNTFINSKHELVSTIRMVPLKRLSCKGCEQCGWMPEYLWEDMSNDTCPDLTEVEDGEAYKLIFIPDPPDYETGIVESGYFVFRQVRDE